MNNKVALPIANGFEEGEALVIVDIFRRLGIKVDILSTEATLEVVSYHHINIKADLMLSEASGPYAMVLMVGGPNGAKALGTNPAVIAFVKKHINDGAFIAAFCSAGAHIMAQNGLWQSRRYVCSGENYKLYPNDGVYTDQDIIIDGKFISGRGFGLVFEFAFTLATFFVDVDKIEWQAEHIYFRHWKSSDIEDHRIN